MAQPQQEGARPAGVPGVCQFPGEWVDAENDDRSRGGAGRDRWERWEHPRQEQEGCDDRGYGEEYRDY
eukprot:11124146-Heterocapsa_arctica.AAC.1